MSPNPKFSLFLLLVATPLILGTPRAAEGISPISHPPILAQMAEEQKVEADRLLQLGIEQDRSSQFQAALQSWEASLQLYREIGDRLGEALSLYNLGGVYQSLNQDPQAIEFYQQAVPIFREIGHRQGEANTLHNLGVAYDSPGQSQQKIELFQQALTLFQEMGERVGEASSLYNLGGTYSDLGQYQKAIEFYQQSLPIKQEIGDRSGEANSLNNLGNAYLNLGEYQKAIAFFEQSLPIYQEVGDRRGESLSLMNLGVTYQNLGEYEKAIAFSQQSLTIQQEIGDLNGESGSLINLGLVYHALGEYEKAIEFYQQSLTIARETGNRNGEGKSLSNLGNAYNNLGQYERAIELHQQSLSIFQAMGDRVGEGAVLGNLGNAYDNLEQYQKAIEFHQQSLAIDREIGDRRGESNSLGNLGNAYLNLGQYERALEFHQQSLAIDREIGDRNGEANSLGNLGNAYLNLGQYEKAIEFYQQSLTLAREIGDRSGEALSLNNLGYSYNALEQYPQATEALFAAIEVYESLRDEDFSDDQKIAFFDTQTSSYKLLQRALVAQGKIEPALEISERGRGRAFVSLLAQKQGLHSSDVPLPPPSIAQIQQLARQENVTLVQYSDVSFEKDDNPKLFVWVIQPTGAIDFRQIDLSSLNQSLYDFVTTTREYVGIRSRNADGAIVPQLTEVTQQRQSLQKLHQLLIEPIADVLPTNPEDPIVFIPHRSLFLVPFPALLNAEGEYLIQNHTLLTAPSIQVLELMQQTNDRVEVNRAPVGDVLVVGNPTMPSVWNPATQTTERLESLPGTEEEAVAIAQLFDTTPLLWNDATETAVTQRMQTARIIHLATHGLLDYGIPEETGVRDFPGAVALAAGNGEEGLLTSAELFDLQLQAELVVLSACNTGRGKLSSDGVIGLSRALISAGVSNAIVSLWSVPDAPTAELMVEFYRQWQETGNKAQALRQAMLATMATHPEPRDWAAFTLIGEAR